MIKPLCRKFFLVAVCIISSLNGILTANSSVCAIEGLCNAAETCCELSHGLYGCCPYPQAQCCADQEYCCPSDYDCAYQSCVRQRGTLSVASKIIYNMIPKETDHLYRDKEICPPHYTNCRNDELQAEYCCPMSNAVCCNDLQHCCPAGSKCSSQEGGCLWDAIISPFVRTTNSFPIKFDKQLPAKTFQAIKSGTPCPDSYSCPPNSTCCLNTEVIFVCCPFENAGCCSEGTYCCPYGTYCTGRYRCKPIPNKNND